MDDNLKNKMSSAAFKATSMFLLRHWDKTAYGTILGSGLWALSQVFSALIDTWEYINKEALTLLNLILGSVLMVNLPSIIGSLVNKHQFKPEIEEGYQYIERMRVDNKLSDEQVRKLHVAMATKVIKNITLKDDIQAQVEKLNSEDNKTE